MSITLVSSPVLRYALVADALVSGATGTLMTAGSGPLSGLLGLPQGLLVAAGLACLVWAVFVGLTARRDAVAPKVVWLIIAFNALWSIESILMVLVGWVHPTLPGTVFVVFQAVVVLGFAEAQFIGLRRAQRPLVAVQ